jgi:ABC-type Fe3+-hydroxamate transport system substrate-binding protein
LVRIIPTITTKTKNSTSIKQNLSSTVDMLSIPNNKRRSVSLVWSVLSFILALSVVRRVVNFFARLT